MPEYNPLKKLLKDTFFRAFEFVMSAQDAPLERYKFYAIGNSHLDAAWRWRAMQTQSKAKHTFKNALRNMANYEEFTFSQSTPQFYEWMKDRHPRIFRAIQNQVKGGHWEITGGMWVEPDCNLPDGESLVRQRLYGQRFYLNHFGKISEIEWLPDTFGFAWSLPQILAKSGAKYFWTTKMLWNDETKFPFGAFLWRGPDGSETLTCVSPLMGLSFLNMRRMKKMNRLVHYNQKLVASSATRPGDINDKISPDTISEIPVFYGIGDGGGGPTEIEIEMIRSLKENGSLEMCRAADYFAELEKYRDRLPVWNDELYLEFHRGCYTSVSGAKSKNRKAEILLRNAEIVSGMNSLFGNQYPGELLRAHWKTALFNQFHDILPGSSIPEVYEDAFEEYEAMFRSTGALVKKGLEYIASKIKTANPSMPDSVPLVVCNTASWPRTSVVFHRIAEGEEDLRVADFDGEEVPSQTADIGGEKTLVFLAKDVPDLGYRTYYLQKGKDGDGDFEKMASVLDDGSISIENEIFRAKLDGESCLLTELIYKGNNRNMISEPSNRFRVYGDEHKLFPAWDIDKNYKNKEVATKGPVSPPSIVENGPVCATVEYEIALTDESTAKVQLAVFRGRPFLTITTVVDWREESKMLKVDFTTSARVEKVASDIPYGTIERPTAPRYPAQKAKWEMPCQKWIDMSDGSAGIALLNQDKYGFSVDGSCVSLTLLRSPVYPPPINGAWGLRPSEDRPKRSDIGTHAIRYGIAPHSGDWRAAEMWKLGQEFNDTMMSVRTDHHRGILPREATALSCRSGSTYVGAIKRPEDIPDKAGTTYHQLIVRLIEAAGKPDNVLLKFGANMTITDAKEMDLLEFSTTPIPGSRPGEVEISMKPFEIKTIKVTIINEDIRKTETVEERS